MSLFKRLIPRHVELTRIVMVKSFESGLQTHSASAWYYGKPSLSTAPLLSMHSYKDRRYYPCEIPFLSVRQYAKKAKESGAKKDSSSAKKGRLPEKPTVQLSSEDLNEVISFDKMKQQMDSTIDHLRKEYKEQLALRTSATMFDTLTVDTSDGQFSLIEIAQVVQKNPQLMLINMAATPQYLVPVKTAIANSGLNVNIQQDGTFLFVPIPRVTREHREALAKNAKTLCDRTKEKLRNIQNTCTRDLKRAKDDHSADLIHNLQETIMSTTKLYMEKAEGIMKDKQQELLNS